MHYEGWKNPQANRSIGGKPLSINGRKFESGIGAHATSTPWLELDGAVERFLASVGVDDVAGNDSPAVIFSAFGDSRKLWDSGVLKRGHPARAVDLNLKGMCSLPLIVDHAGESNPFDLADWAYALFVFSGARPRSVAAPREEAVMLTPKPPREPRREQHAAPVIETLLRSRSICLSSLCRSLLPCPGQLGSQGAPAESYTW